MNKQTILETLDRNEGRNRKLSDFVQKGGYASIRDGFAGHPRSPSFESGQSTAKKPPDDDPDKPLEYLPPELRGRDTHTDPTGAAAVQALNYGDSARDARRFTKIVQAIDNLYAEAEQIVARHTPRDPGLFDQQETAEPEPGCVSCARVAGPGTVGRPKNQQAGWWNAATRSTTLNDGEKVNLCNACYESVEVGARWTGELPPKDWVEYLRDNGRPRKRSA